MEEYSPRRLYVILGMAVAAALVAFFVGFPSAALGVLAGTPVGVLNYWLTLSAIRRSRGEPGPKMQGMVLGRSLLRMLISVGALLAAAPFGPAFLIGVLVGLILEVFSYFGDVLGLVMRRKG